MSHLNGSGSAHVYDRWMRIQQKDVMHELNHLQNHLGTMRDSLLCFRSTVYTLNIDDVALLHIKNAVKKVTQSMDEMRFCFKHVGRNLGSIGDKDSQGASCVRTENNHGTTSQIHFPYGLPPDYDSTLIRDILPPSDQRVPVQQTSGISSTPIDNWQLRDRQTHVTEEAKSQTVSLVRDKAEASADSLVTSNERSEADTESDHFAQPAATQEEHFEETLEYPGSSYDHVLESTYQTPDLVPEDAPELIYDQIADGCDEPAEIFAHVPGGTSVAASACEASGYVVDLNLDVTGDAQESALPLYSEVVAYEEHRLYDQAERLDSDQTTEVSHPGPPLDETFVSAIQASHPRSDTSAAEAAQSNDDHDVELDLVPVHTGNETILEETARVSVPDSEAYEGQTVSFELDPDVDPLEVQIVTEEHSGDATKLDDALERVRTDQLSVSVAEASDSQMPLQTQRYRNGRESPECENGSLDGFLSPLPNEARPSCDSNVPPDYCDIDGLTESLEKFWSLGEKSPIISGRSPPVQSLPKSGKIPRTIEEFRLPPPLKYVPTIISSCADDGLYVQLMADEGAILGFDGLIIKGSRGAPLKFAEVQPGDFVLCMYDLDNRFYRAQLLKAAGDDKFEVRFVDYGNSCIASVKNMRQIPAGCRRFGQHALKCEFSEELKTNAEEIKRQLELVSLDAYFLACFAPNYVDRDREPPIFTLIDMQKIDGTGILRVPPPSSLESLNAQFVVRNLELGSLGTAKLDLVEDLERKKAIAEMLRTSPKLPCKRDCVKEGSLVAYKCQRARVAKLESNTRLSLELIDEFQNILTDIPLAECSYLPLAAVNIPPTASCVVRVDKFQDMEMLNELCLSGSDIQMTVVGVDVLPLAKFSRIENGLSGGLAVADTKLE